MRDLPEQMVEAAARALYNLRRESGRDHWAAIHNDDIRKLAARAEARGILIVALEGYDILPVITGPQPESQGGR